MFCSYHGIEFVEFDAKEIVAGGKVLTPVGVEDHITKVFALAQFEENQLHGCQSILDGTVAVSRRLDLAPQKDLRQHR